MLGGLGALGILALLVFGHITLTSVVGIAIALSNAFGLIAGDLCTAPCVTCACHTWLSD